VGPKSWEGWVATAVYVVAILTLSGVGRRFGVEPWMIGAAGLALTIGFLALAVFTGDHQPWRWRWGGKR
jgi:hypothetical protein